MRRAIQMQRLCREALLRLPGRPRRASSAVRVLYKRRLRRPQSANCCCELSLTGCRRSLSAAPPESGTSVRQFAQQLNRSQEVGYVLVPS